MNRRHFLQSAGLLATGSVFAEPDVEFIIDMHQHVNFSGRNNEVLLAHQNAMGINKSILLPAGSPVEMEATHMGKSNGLAALIFGTAAAAKLAAAHPEKFVFFANEVPGMPETKANIEKWLKAGAKGIGEQKFNLACDSEPMQLVYQIARDHDVPVLMHFEHERYNHGIERMHKMLEKYPTVNFLGHAQAWWGNIDKAHNQSVNYPTGKVSAGGISDRLLADYPNMFGDLSAGSGLNAVTRDPEHAAAFFDRHQDKLCYGSDCSDTPGNGPKCSGSQMLQQIRALIPEAKTRTKILSENIQRIVKF